MNTINELFEAQGEPIEAKDIREGDQIAARWEGATGYAVFVAEPFGVRTYADRSYRLIQRAAPTLPTSPGSILVGLGGTPRAVLVPGLGWYGINTEIFMSKKMLQKRLADGEYTILLDTGSN